MFEQLDARRLLSVALNNGVLTITGREIADQIGVGRTQTMIVVSDNGMRSMWNPAEVMSISIGSLGGNDRVQIGAGVNKPILINAGAGDDEIYGGTGPEHIFGGLGMDRIYGGGGGDLLDGGEDNDFIGGGPGQDVMLGGPGNDRFDAVDRNVDMLDGGDGEDAARVNMDDQVQNIEHLFFAPPHNGSTVTFTDGGEVEVPLT